MVKENTMKQTEIGLLPYDWEVYKIEDLTPKNVKYTIVDGPFGSNLKTIHYRKKGIPIITSGYVTDGKFYAEEYLYVDNEKFQQEKRSSVQAGDIIMAKIGERCGASAILPLNHTESILSGNALKIKIDKERFSSNLIAQILYNDYLRGNLNQLRTVGAQPAISMANLKIYKIPLPLLPEQEAIAEVLSDTDRLIESLEKLIAKKRLIKLGAMQELLTSKEDWEVKKLGDVLVKTPDYGLNAAAVKYSDELPNYLRITDIGNNGEYLIDSKVSVNHQLAINYVLDAGDVCIARTGASVGKSYYHNKKNGNLVFAGFLIRLKTDPQLLNSRLLFYITKSKSYDNFIISNSMRSGQPGINSFELQSFEICIPKSITEQTHIETILSGMDTELEALDNQLKKARQIKQGMMQELLTGRTRLI